MDIEELRNINELLSNDGQISLGSIGPISCAAVASDDDICYAMLVRKSGESLSELLYRLDMAIYTAIEDGVFIDEINSA